MARGEILAWAQPWLGGIPGAIVKGLGEGLAEFTELPCDGPPKKHPPMTVSEAMKLFEELTEVPSHAPAPTDPHRGP